MAFQLNQVTFDFRSGMGTVALFEQPVPPSTAFKNVSANFSLKPKPTGETPDAATEEEIKAEAKAALLAAAAAL
jgi:hypothetical protein